MTIRKLLFASSAALMLSSCVTVPPPLTAADLLSTPYTLSVGEAFDVDAFFAALPEWLSVKYGNAAFDGSVGAMVVDGVVFELVSAPGYLLHVDQLKIWDADISAMETVFDGLADTDQMSLLFDRIAFSGVRSQGLQWDSGAQSVGLSIGKLVMDGVAARSFSLTPKEQLPEGAGMLRTFAALANSYAYDGIAYSNFSFQASDNQGNAALFGLDQIFARGYDAGKLDYYSVSGLTSTSSGAGNAALNEVSQALTEQPDDTTSKILNHGVRERMEEMLRNPVAALASANGGMETGREIERMEMRGMDLSGALSWLARWELPPITEIDLLDFGSSTIIGDKQSLNGKVFLENNRTEMSAFDFYWLVPSKVSATSTGSRMDLMMLVDEISKASPEGSAEIAQLKDAVVAMGLEQISFDADMDWAWDGVTGAVQLQTGVDITDFASLAYGVDLGGPNLVEWDALARSGQMDTGAKEVSLGAFNFSLTDYQMLDRVFSYVAMQSGGTAEDLRAAMPVLLRASSGEIAQMNPRIPGYIDAIANFLERGGNLSIDVSPSTEIPFSDLEALGQAPQTVPDVLNLNVTHSD